ncbi:Tom37 C-terminal domain-containing protein [Chaetomium sp. MPI-SDFR-AT-0129]|nr:Tom37 C-terminal domain-containing protein [Chaetomium sp. MPI-SDFR-AT-0129]
MALQLHVWGPAFGLPSLDAECLAAIAYLTQSVAAADYQLIQSSPSAAPTQHLPALYDSQTSTWKSGFSSIAAHIRSNVPSTQPRSTSTTANSTAYTTFLTAHAAPLLALSLYVSSTNYTATTRPAYSAVLPLPLPWTEPPAIRAAMSRRAAHLGLSSLDADAVLAREREEERRVAAEGWVTVPASLSSGGKKKSVEGAMSPEQKARIKLERVAGEVLDVLGEVEWGKDGGVTREARCLAFGYLALMLIPDVPRPWLREIIQARYPGLCEFVSTFRWEVFPDGRELSWTEGRKDTQGGSTVGLRFVRGVLWEVPVVGEWWSRWWTTRKKREVFNSKGVKTGSGGDLLLFLGTSLGLASLGAGIFMYRGLPPFGEAVQVWKRPAVTLSSFGAAGAMFSGALYGV